MTRKVKSYLSGMKVVIDETELDHMSQQCEPSGERLLLLLLLLLFFFFFGAPSTTFLGALNIEGEYNSGWQILFYLFIFLSPQYYVPGGIKY